MAEEKKKPFDVGDMVIGACVGFFLDIIGGIVDILSFGAGGAFVQGTAWPFLKKFWIDAKSGNSGDILKDYILPMVVQTIPILPSMFATIPAYMAYKNGLSESGIMNIATKVAAGAATGGTGTVALKTANAASKINRVAGTTQKVETMPTYSSKPRVLSMPNSPIRTQNNPIIQKHNEEQEEIRRAA